MSAFWPMTAPMEPAISDTLRFGGHIHRRREDRTFLNFGHEVGERGPDQTSPAGPGALVGLQGLSGMAGRASTMTLGGRPRPA